MRKISFPGGPAAEKISREGGAHGRLQVRGEELGEGHGGDSEQQKVLALEDITETLCCCGHSEGPDVLTTISSPRKSSF